MPSGCGARRRRQSLIASELFLAPKSTSTSEVSRHPLAMSHGRAPITRGRKGARIMKATGLSMESFAVITIFASACGFSEGASGDYDLLWSDDANRARTTLVDNFDDNDGQAWYGQWFSYNDGSDTCEQNPPPRLDLWKPTPDDRRPLGETLVGASLGDGCTSWGAGIGLDFQNSGHDTATEGAVEYSLEKYRAVRLLYRSVGELRVKLATSQVVPTQDGGDCVEPGVWKHKSPIYEWCYDAHGFDLPATGGQWAAIEIAFEDLEQEGYGKRVGFLPRFAMKILFQVGRDEFFNFAIDDLSLVRR